MKEDANSARTNPEPLVDGTSAVASMLNANTPTAKVWKQKQIPTGVTRLVREPGDPFAFGEGLHADVTFFEKPPVFTFLVARELPGGLDDTHFVDTGRALREMPESLRRTTTGLNAVHDDSAGSHTIHPAVRTHPETSEQALYVNSHFTHSVLGYGSTNYTQEGQSLLSELFEHVDKQPRFRFKWSCENSKCSAPYRFGECDECLHVLMWDNRALQHTSTTNWAFDDTLNKRRRELHRITISHSHDTRPYYRPSARDHRPF